MVERVGSTRTRMTSNNFLITEEAERIRNYTVTALKALTFDSVFVDAVQHIATTHGLLFFLGVGKSGIIAEKLAATFASLAFPAFFMHPIEALHGDMGRIRSGDTIIALSNSGTTVELLEALNPIQQRNVTLISISGNTTSALAKRAQFPLSTGFLHEACAWDIVPTTSLMLTMLLGDAMALCASQCKERTKEDFARNHPKGALGALLHNMVENAMQKDNLPVVLDSVIFADALDILNTHNNGAVFVINDKKELQGILTDGDIRRLVVQKTFTFEAPVIEYMNVNPKVGFITMTTAELLDAMERNAITILPIVDSNNILQGILHIHDILGRGSIQFY